MLGRKTPLDRVVDALGAVVNAGGSGQITMKTRLLWNLVKKEVVKAQKAEFGAARSLGKKPKRDDCIPWMGADERAHQEFVNVLRNIDLKSKLKLRGCSISLTQDENNEVIELHIRRDPTNIVPESTSDEG